MGSADEFDDEVDERDQPAIARWTRRYLMASGAAGILVALLLLGSRTPAFGGHGLGRHEVPAFAAVFAAVGAATAASGAGLARGRRDRWRLALGVVAIGSVALPLAEAAELHGVPVASFAPLGSIAVAVALATPTNRKWFRDGVGREVHAFVRVPAPTLVGVADKLTEYEKRSHHRDQ